MEIQTNKKQRIFSKELKIEIIERNYQPLLPVSIGLTELQQPTFQIRKDNNFGDYVITFTGVWKSMILEYDYFADTELSDGKDVVKFIYERLEPFKAIISIIIKLCKKSDGILLSSFNLFAMIYLLRTRKMTCILDEEIVKQTILFNAHVNEIEQLNEFLHTLYKVEGVIEYGFKLPPICKQYTTKPYDRLSRLDVSVINGLTNKTVVWIPKWKKSMSQLVGIINDTIASHHGELDVQCPHYFEYINQDGLFYDVLYSVMRNWQIMVSGLSKEKVLSTRYNASLGIFNGSSKLYFYQLFGSGYPHIDFNLDESNLGMIHSMVLELITPTIEICNGLIKYQPPVGSNILPFVEPIGETYITWKIQNNGVPVQTKNSGNLNYKQVEVNPDTNSRISVNKKLNNLRGLMTLKRNDFNSRSLITSIFSGYLINVTSKPVKNLKINVKELEEKWMDYHGRLKYELNRFNPLENFSYESDKLLEKVIDIAKETSVVLYAEIDVLFKRLMRDKIKLNGSDIEFLSVYLTLIKQEYYSQLDANIGIIIDYTSELINVLNDLRRLRYVKSYSEAFGHIQIGGDINSLRLVTNFCICYLSVLDGETVYEYTDRIIKLINYLNYCVRKAYFIKIPCVSDEILKLLSNKITPTFTQVSVIHVANHYAFDGGIWLECVTSGRKGFNYLNIIKEYGLEYMSQYTELPSMEPKMYEIYNINDAIEIQDKVGYGNSSYGVCLYGQNYNDFVVNLSICSQLFKKIMISKFVSNCEELTLVYGICDPITCRIFGRSGVMYKISDTTCRRLYPTGKVDSSTIRTYQIKYGANMKVGSLMNYAMKLYAKIKHDQYKSRATNEIAVNGHVFDIGGRQFESIDFVNKSDQWTIYDPFLQSDIVANNCRVGYHHQFIDLAHPFEVPDDISVIIGFFMLQDQNDTVQSVLTKITNIINVAKRVNVPAFFNVYSKVSREYIKEIPGVVYDGTHGTFEGYSPVMLLERSQVLGIDPHHIKFLEIPKGIILKIMCRYWAHYPIDYVHKFDVLSEFVGLYKFEP